MSEEKSLREIIKNQEKLLLCHNHDKIDIAEEVLKQLTKGDWKEIAQNEPYLIGFITDTLNELILKEVV